MEHLSEIKPNAYAVNLPTFEEIQLAKRKKKHTETGKKPTAATKTKKDAAPSTATDVIPEPESTVEVPLEAQESMPPVETAGVIQEAAPAAEAPAETQEPEPAAAAPEIVEEPVSAGAVSAEEPEEPTQPVEAVSASQPSAPVEEPAAAPEEPALPPEVGDTVVIQHTRVIYDDGSRLYTIESNGKFFDASLDLDKIIQTIRTLAPDAKEEELALLKLL